MLGRVAHVEITVRNMERSLSFYEQVLGMTRIGETVILIGNAVSRLTTVVKVSPFARVLW